MGGLFSSEETNNPDLIESVIYPTESCSLGRFEASLGAHMDPRLYYFMSHEQYLFELRQFDKRLSDGDSDCCTVCCASNLIGQVERDLQVLAMHASMRHAPLQFSVLAQYNRQRKRRGRWIGWRIRVLLPTGTAERFNADVRAGRPPSRMVLVAPTGSEVPMRMSMGQPGYGSVGRGEMQQMPVQQGMAARNGETNGGYFAAPSAPPDHIAAPPPYSRFEEGVPASVAQPPAVEKPQMV